ncbi:MAG: polysaccharide deacetylase family protein [Betaproteobacteria bacterium]|nr:polysaccharide deacetylase family protein [Betaproteobacteria bacterium]
MRRRLLRGIAGAGGLLLAPGTRARERTSAGAPILLYHRFGATVTDAMTVTTAVFESQLRRLQERGYTVIPLNRLVAWITGDIPAPGPRAVAITADDGHRSQYTEFFPLVRRHRIPVTLFIYPSAISNASYALTWEQLAEMKASGLVDIQSHTYWHPNFRKDRRRLAPEAYGASVTMQLTRSREVLERRLGSPVRYLAWPFGIYDEDLMDRARRAGYGAAFTMDRRHAGPHDSVMAIPRYRVTDRDRGRAFAALLGETGQTAR